MVAGVAPVWLAVASAHIDRLPASNRAVIHTMRTLRLVEVGCMCSGIGLVLSFSLYSVGNLRFDFSARNNQGMSGIASGIWAVWSPFPTSVRGS